MTLAEIVDIFKKKLNLPRVANPLERVAELYYKSSYDSEGNESKDLKYNQDLKKNPYLDLFGDTVKGSGTVRGFQEGDPIIRLNNVWKIYQMGEADFAALRGVSLEIYEGEFLVVVGTSGSGKSTLMNLIGCLDLPSNGMVFLNSKDISGLEESELARIRGQMIGFIFQSFNLIPTLSTQENVLLPMEFQEEDARKAREKADYLLEIVGLSDKKQNLPSQLSGGQRQRVAIARSLAVDPPIILADEPTGNLDSKTGGYILEFLDNLHEKKGKTIIIVTHDLEIIKHATRIVYLKDGEIEKIEKRKKNGSEE
jgi:putative ABC transport system ATP-binding protein